MMEWQWHQLDRMQIYHLHLAPDKITMPVPHHSVCTVWMAFLLPNQQRQSTKGIAIRIVKTIKSPLNLLVFRIFRSNF